MLKIIAFNYDDILELVANCYIVYDDFKNAVIIDPGSENPKIINAIEREELNLKAILLTHGHFDHIRGVDLLKNRFDVPAYIHEDDEIMLRDTHLNGSLDMGDNLVVVNSLVKTYKDKESFNFLNEEMVVVHTPFHTLGSSCFYFCKSNMLFSGDTLFKEGFGRYDLPHSNHRLLLDSLNKLFNLPKETKVYPGHGKSTTIGEEASRYRLK